MSPLTIIVAATRTNGIGKNSQLPWRLPKEMAYFARMTSRAPEGRMNAVVMGRNTWESIPDKFRPLANRVNVVVSRNQDYQLKTSAQSPAPIALRSDLTAILTELSMPTFADKDIHRRFIIGGALLYNECLLLPVSDTAAYVDRVLLTRILSPGFEECDVFLPDFLADAGAKQWKRASHDELKTWAGFDVPEGVQQEKGIEYEFQMWVRQGAGAGNDDDS